MMQIIDSVEQGSPEWKALRLGIVTCSEIECLMVNGKGEGGFGEGALSYMNQLIGERITGQEAGSWGGNWYSDNGHTCEPIAIDLYCARTEADPAVISHPAIIMNHGCGYSPDGVVGDDGLLEVKTKIPKKLVDVILSGAVPKEHVAQIQGGLWVSGREWCDFIAYWPGMPLVPIRMQRDESYIAKMAVRVAQFYKMLDERLERVMAA